MMTSQGFPKGEGGELFINNDNLTESVAPSQSEGSTCGGNMCDAAMWLITQNQGLWSRPGIMGSIRISEMI